MHASPGLRRYRVVVPFLVMRNEPEQKPNFVTLAVGTTILTANDFHDPGFVAVYSGSDILLAFARDLRERTELIESARTD